MLDSSLLWEQVLDNALNLIVCANTLRVRARVQDQQFRELNIATQTLLLISKAVCQEN